jgi:acetyl-CoA C-acetyltransferase
MFLLSALLERAGLEPSTVDDVVLGPCCPTVEAPAIGRVAAPDFPSPRRRSRWRA